MSRRNELPLRDRSYMVNGVPVRDTRPVSENPTVREVMACVRKRNDSNQQSAADVIRKMHADRIFREVLDSVSVYDPWAMPAETDRSVARHVRWFAWAVSLLCVGAAFASAWEKF